MAEDQEVWMQSLKPLEEYDFAKQQQPSQSEPRMHVVQTVANGPVKRPLYEVSEVCGSYCYSGWRKIPPAFSVNDIVEFDDRRKSCTLFTVISVVYMLDQIDTTYCAIPVYCLKPVIAVGRSYHVWAEQGLVCGGLNVSIASPMSGRIMATLENGKGPMRVAIMLNGSPYKNQALPPNLSNFTIDGMASKSFTMVFTDSLNAKLVVSGAFDISGKLLAGVRKEYVYAPRVIQDSTPPQKGMCLCCKSGVANIVLFGQLGITCNHLCYCTDCSMVLEKKCPICGFVGDHCGRAFSYTKSTR